jgi:hypothetical protein
VVSQYRVLITSTADISKDVNRGTHYKVKGELTPSALRALIKAHSNRGRDTLVLQPNVDKLRKW